VRIGVPQSQTINTAFRLLQSRLSTVEKKINAAAAKEMKLGKYQNAQDWMNVGKTVAEYQQRVKAFDLEWKHLVRAARIAARPMEPIALKKASAPRGGGITPAWKFCEPSLKALSVHGGRATFAEILADLQEMLAAVLTDADHALSSKKSTPRWHNQVQRAYRQCQGEGWIDKEKRSKGEWRITEKGRALVEKKE
jgi:hypothetical protein